MNDENEETHCDGSHRLRKILHAILVRYLLSVCHVHNIAMIVDSDNTLNVTKTLRANPRATCSICSLSIGSDPSDCQCIVFFGESPFPAFELFIARERQCDGGCLPQILKYAMLSHQMHPTSLTVTGWTGVPIESKIASQIASIKDSLDYANCLRVIARERKLLVDNSQSTVLTLTGKFETIKQFVEDITAVFRDPMNKSETKIRLTNDNVFCSENISVFYGDLHCELNFVSAITCDWNVCMTYQLSG